MCNATTTTFSTLISCTISIFSTSTFFTSTSISTPMCNATTTTFSTIITCTISTFSTSTSNDSTSTWLYLHYRFDITQSKGFNHRCTRNEESSVDVLSRRWTLNRMKALGMNEWFSYGGNLLIIGEGLAGPGRIVGRAVAVGSGWWRRGRPHGAEGWAVRTQIRRCLTFATKKIIIFF